MIRKNRLTQFQRITFRKHFGIPIDRYWNQLFGFDIIAFDEEFVKSDAENMSCADMLTKNYGEESTKFVESLLSMLPVEDLLQKFRNGMQCISHSNNDCSKFTTIFKEGLL